MHLESLPAEFWYLNGNNELGYAGMEKSMILHRPATNPFSSKQAFTCQSSLTPTL